MEKADEVCSFLALFHEVTKLISGSEYPTSNLFLLELWRINEILEEKAIYGSAFMQSMVMKMKTKFDKYWGNCNLLFSIAVVLDPKNKPKLIEFCFPMIYRQSEFCILLEIQYLCPNS